MALDHARRRVMRSLVAAFVMLATLHGLSGVSCTHLPILGAAAGAAAPQMSHAGHGAMGGGLDAGAQQAQAAHQAADEGDRGNHQMPGCHCPGDCVCAPLGVATVVPNEQWTAVVAHDTAPTVLAVDAPSSRAAWLLPPATAPPALLETA